LERYLFNIEHMQPAPYNGDQSPTRESLVSLRRVSRFYGSNRSALFDISLDIFPGEFVYITGPSGAGKSTLLKMLGALDTPDTGKILFSGHDLAALKRSAVSLLRRSMGIVFQDFRLVPDISIGANIALPLEVLGLSSAEIVNRTGAVLRKVGLGGRQRELAGELSGGEQQRVALARAIVVEPELLLADEPTGNLDAYNADFVLDLLEQTRDAGATVILATHDRMLMAARPHRTIALDNGRILGMSSSGIANASTEPQPAPGRVLRSTG
jgi:cell division transport system ATP-binding protein